MREQTTEQNKAPEQPAPERLPESSRRINPRWFLLEDPDRFFSDLLMEQEEQG